MTAQGGRSAKRQDGETRLGPKGEHAVGSEADDAPTPSRSNQSMVELTLKPCPEISREEFCARFKARMLARTAPVTEFVDGTSIAEYADDAAPAYFDDEMRTDESPEECADTDISYWDD